MATHSGHEGVVKIAANTIAEVVGFTVDETTDTVEDTELSDTDKSFIAGQKSWTASIEAHFDETDTTGQDLLINGATITIIFYPIGEVSGDITLTGSGIVTGLSRANSAGAPVSASFSLQGSGALVEAAIV